jgi:hypothetical protein
VKRDGRSEKWGELDAVDQCLTLRWGPQFFLISSNLCIPRSFPDPTFSRLLGRKFGIASRSTKNWRVNFESQSTLSSRTYYTAVD